MPYESCCELLDYELEDGAVITPEILNDKLPQGIRVLEIVQQGRKKMHAQIYAISAPENVYIFRLNVYICLLDREGG